MATTCWIWFIFTLDVLATGHSNVTGMPGRTLDEGFGVDVSIALEGGPGIIKVDSVGEAQPMGEAMMGEAVLADNADDSLFFCTLDVCWQWHSWVWIFYVVGIIVSVIGGFISYVMIALKKTRTGVVYLCFDPSKNEARRK